MKINVLIKGNLICTGSIGGGCVISNKTSDQYDCSDAVILDGDVKVDGSADFGNLAVLVLGNTIGGQ